MESPMTSSPVTRYHPALVALHWALAVLIIADLAIGSLVLVHIPNDAPKKIEGLRAHMVGGLLILTFMLVRLTVRLRTMAPVEATTGSTALDHVAWWSHRLLYFAIFGMALSGLIMGLQTHLPDVVFFGRGKVPDSFWIYPLRSVHYALSRLLMALIGLHICGALYHVFIRRDHLLRRMWFGRRYADAAVAGPTVTDRLWIYAPWLNRVILAAPLILFTRIGTKYAGAPEQVADASAIVLGSPAAVTDMRAMGAMFLAVAVLILFSLLSARRMLSGLTIVVTIIGVVTAARILGVLVDGAAAETILKLRAEIVLLTLTTVGILVELGRRRHLARTMSPA
jgi:cytochrome b561